MIITEDGTEISLSQEDSTSNEIVLKVNEQEDLDATSDHLYTEEDCELIIP